MFFFSISIQHLHIIVSWFGVISIKYEMFHVDTIQILNVSYPKSPDVQMQGNLWPGAASGGGGASGAGCVLGADSLPSSCMSPYPHPHPHSNLQGFMGMPPSQSHPHHHHHHHHPSHHPGINGLYSLHSFPGGLGPHSMEGPESDYKPTGLVALRMKAKEPGSILSWPTWPQQSQLHIMHWLSQRILHPWPIHIPQCTYSPQHMSQIIPLNSYVSHLGGFPSLWRS